nr:NAD-binding protein [Propylenella binzhouense]
MLVTPLLGRLGRLLATRLQRRQDEAAAAGPDLSGTLDHVVVGGFGRVGQMIARILEREGVPVVAIDTNAELCGEHMRAGRAVFLGDAARPEMLERTGADRARAFIVTVDAPAAAERMVRSIRRRRPDAPVFARARDQEHARALADLGAIVIPEALEGSLQLAGRVLEGLGVPDDEVLRRLDEERSRQAALLEPETV